LLTRTTQLIRVEIPSERLNLSKRIFKRERHCESVANKSGHTQEKLVKPCVLWIWGRFRQVDFLASKRGLFLPGCLRSANLSVKPTACGIDMGFKEAV